MSNKKLIVLGILAILSVAWAIFQAKLASKPFQAEKMVQSYMIQGLNTDSIASIEIKSADNSVTLNRTSNGFLVQNKDNYPAKTSTINELITQILDIKTVQLITRDKQNYDQLEVTEETASNTVKFFDNKQNLITGIYIGKSADSSGGSYARILDSNDVYLVQNVPWIKTSPLDYADKQLIEVKSDDIAAVTVSDPNGKFTLRTEPNSTEVIMDNLPADKQLTNQNEVFTALTNLQFSDVFSNASAPNDLNFNNSYICELQDSTVYTLRIAKQDDRTFVKCSAKFTNTEKVTKAREVESQEQLKEKEAILLAREAAEIFNLKHQNWIYEIAKFEADSLTKSMDDILEDMPSIEPEEPNEPEIAVDPNA